MSKAIIQIDGNNFYASCEQIIDPSIKGKGLVVLSNNDGCIISRSSEARKLGIPMGAPYFKLKNKLNKLNIIVRSSNYELYGDISNRLMHLLKKNCEAFEIYSIDEAFATIKRPKEKQLYQWGKDLRTLVYQNIGIPITIGIGETKVQSKIANHIAKKVEKNSGIFDIAIVKNKDNYLNQIKVDTVWGVGRKMSEWLKSKGITNARELRDMSPQQIKRKYGLIGIRLQNELKGIPSIPLKDKASARKEICVSRSFSYPIDNLEELKQAIAKYAVIASTKIRYYNQLSSAITVFTTTNHYYQDFYTNEATTKLEIPSNDTIIILKTSLELTEKIFKPYKKLIKAGIILHKLQTNQYQQESLFDNLNIQEEKNNLIRLNNIIDKINQKNGRNTLNWASSVLESDWHPHRKKTSGYSTTNIENIPSAYAI